MNQQEKERLLLLLLHNPRSWSDQDIETLLAHSQEIKDIVSYLWKFFPDSVERVQRYRAHQKELSGLSTEELVRKRNVINARRAAAMADDPDDMKLSDSFFEVTSIYSDKHIIDKILQERFEAEFPQ
jgi:AAA+ superfamily predicted ATPase